MSLIITSNRSPDTDGTACILAYSEFLSKSGTENKIHFSDKPDPMGQFLLNELKLRAEKQRISKSDEIILVDASQLGGLPKEIPLENVVEIIDHRKSRELHLFPNARKVQNEQVGAAATLVAERFFSAGIVPSRISAALLLSAITVNTTNFSSKVTTGRDRRAASKLRKIARLPNGFLKRLFKASENFSIPLGKVLSEEFAGQDDVGIIQIETADGASFVRRNRSLLSRELPKLFSARGVSIGFLSCLDLEKKRNVFFAPSAEAREFIKKTIGGAKFSGSAGIRKPPIMRKEIWVLLKN
ncbi:MAG: DHH family phosphoesterase [archaeon]